MLSLKIADTCKTGMKQCKHCEPEGCFGNGTENDVVTEKGYGKACAKHAEDGVSHSGER